MVLDASVSVADSLVDSLAFLYYRSQHRALQSGTGQDRAPRPSFPLRTHSSPSFRSSQSSTVSSGISGLPIRQSPLAREVFTPSVSADAEDLSIPRTQDQEDHRVLCTVCLANPVKIILIPCGHISVCRPAWTVSQTIKRRRVSTVQSVVPESWASFRISSWVRRRLEEIGAVPPTGSLRAHHGGPGITEQAYQKYNVIFPFLCLNRDER